VVLTLDLLAFLGRPIPRNNNHLLLRACSDRTSQPVAHLVGVHLVRRGSLLSVRCHELISSRCKHHWPEAVYIRTNHPTTAGGWRRLWFVRIPTTTEPPKPRSTGYHWTLWESTSVWAGEYCPDGAATTGWMYVIIQLYYLNITQRTTQYLATLRPNSPAPDCLAILEEAVCSGTPSSKARSSKLANRPPSACSETSRPPQQLEAESLATTLPTRRVRPLLPHKPAFSETPLDSRLRSRRTTHLEVEPASSVAHLHLQLVQRHPTHNPLEAQC